MCGIAGAVGRFARVDADVLRRMTDRIAHRGPDADGHFVDAHNGVFLGHRRLSILDIAGGAQPMESQDGRFVLVYNGEIYNFRELRRELEAQGAHFRSDHSDTEVLLHGYRAWGRALPGRLNGMWAFALLDRERKELFLSRDRFGKKPLYWHAGREGFAFASELTALREHPAVPSTPSPLAIRKYFAYGYIPAPLTHLEGVHKLPAGHSMTVDLATCAPSVERYWAYEAEPADVAVTARAADAWTDELIALLDAAVQRRLVADVPVGAFLSGGIDSSMVAALAMRHVGREQLTTFSIGFDEAGFDETAHAALVARHIGASHVVETLSIERALEILPRLARDLDEPFADSSLLPTYLLCQHARRHATVALGGDGADELFAGYDPFKALRHAQVWSHLPRPVHRAVSMLAARLPVSHGYMSFDFKVKRMLRGLDHPAHLWLPTWMAPLSHADLEALAGEPVDLDAVYSEAIDAWDNCPSKDPVDRATNFFVRLYLQEDILAKVDRASMLHSLEVRAPFLDIDLVDFARRLPSSVKLRGNTTKWLLKRAAERFLPREIVHRRKQGFAVPIGRWFAQGALPADPAALSAPFWRGKLDAHRRGVADHRLALWSQCVVFDTLAASPRDARAPDTRPAHA